MPSSSSPPSVKSSMFQPRRIQSNPYHRTPCHPTYLTPSLTLPYPFPPIRFSPLPSPLSLSEFKFQPERNETKGPKQHTSYSFRCRCCPIGRHTSFLTKERKGKERKSKRRMRLLKGDSLMRDERWAECLMGYSISGSVMKEEGEEKYVGKEHLPLSSGKEA